MTTVQTGEWTACPTKGRIQQRLYVGSATHNLYTVTEGPMYTVIDTIQPSRSWMDRHPELAGHPEGVLAILEPQEISEAPDLRGMMARVERPDGTAIDLRIDSYEVSHRVVGIFFNGLSGEEIPRLSRVEWQKGTK